MTDQSQPAVIHTVLLLNMLLPQNILNQISDQIMQPLLRVMAHGFAGVNNATSFYCQKQYKGLDRTWAAGFNSGKLTSHD